MKYFKCVLVGSAASVLSGLIYILMSFVISFSVEDGGGNGAEFSEVTTTFTAGPLMLTILLAGFAIGFFWMLQRTAAPSLDR
jgi:hypothetical protein